MTQVAVKHEDKSKVGYHQICRELASFYRKWDYTKTEPNEAHEEYLFGIFEPMLNAGVDLFTKHMQIIKLKLKMLSFRSPVEVLHDLLKLRDTTMEVHNELTDWFPECFRPPLRGFPFEVQRMCGPVQADKRWHCIARLVSRFPCMLKQCKETQMSIYDWGASIARKVNAKIMSIPSGEFVEFFPQIPSHVRKQVEDLPECAVCMHTVKLRVNTSAFKGHEKCSETNAICYECLRIHAWIPQHNDKRVFTMLRKVACPFCRYKLSFPELEDIIVEKLSTKRPQSDYGMVCKRQRH